MSSARLAPVVFIHGAWVTPTCWTKLQAIFESRGYECHAPAWPFVPERASREYRLEPDPRLGSLTIGEITDSYAAFADTLEREPILIGHSFGGLVVQKLLDRGVGAAGVAINPAPIAGIIPDLQSIKTITPILMRFAGWRRSYALSAAKFASSFANTLEPWAARKVFEAETVPAPGAIFFQAALWAGTRVNPIRREAPLLVTSSTADRTVTPRSAQATFRKQRRSGAITDFAEFEGLSHYLIAEAGHEQVATRILEWLEGMPSILRQPASDSAPLSTLMSN